MLVIPILAFGNLVVSECFFILAEVVIALATAHEEKRQTTLWLNFIVWLLAQVPSLIEDGSTEIVKCSLVVMHHHVALATLVVSHCEF